MTNESADFNSPGFEAIVQELVERDPEMFGWLRTALQTQAPLPPADAETHLELAMAYAKMGLTGDALMEAAAALEDERHLTRPRALKALSLLLNRRYLQVQVDELLIVVREKLIVH